MSIDCSVAVLGAGNIGSALIGGLIEAKALKPEQIVAADVSDKQLDSLSKTHKILVMPRGNVQAVRQADVVVLAVKPYLVGDVLGEIREELRPSQILISVAAGVSIAFIESHLAKPQDAAQAASKQPVVRAMPNVAMTVHASATALCCNEAAGEEQRRVAEQIFRSVGTVAWVAEEKMHAVTGLSGSGPAYVYLILEGLTAGGVNMGLPPDVARGLAAQTLLGAATLAQQSTEHPAVLRDRVTTPGGTTIAGIAELERHAVRSALMEAVEAATMRSEEMGRKL